MIVTDLFKGAQVATAQIDEEGVVAVCVVHESEAPAVFEMHIDKIMNFLDLCRREQARTRR